MLPSVTRNKRTKPHSQHTGPFPTQTTPTNRVLILGELRIGRLEEARHPKTGEIITPGARPVSRRLQAIIDQGRDPREVKAAITAADVAKREKAKQDEAPALDAWNVYIQARTHKWSERHKADHETMSRDGDRKSVG